MKALGYIAVIPLVSLIALAEEPRHWGEYVSTIELTLLEADPILLTRGRRLVVEEIGHTFGDWPEVKTQGQTAQADGNRVVFSFLTADDRKTHVHRDVITLTEHLGGKVEMRGKARIFRAARELPVGGFLEIKWDKGRTKIKSIRARSVPFRDVLGELRHQIKDSTKLNYLLPEACASQRVNYHYSAVVPRDIDAIINELAVAFGLEHVKTARTHILSGQCSAHWGAGPIVEQELFAMPFLEIAPDVGGGEIPTVRAIPVVYPRVRVVD